MPDEILLEVLKIKEANMIKKYKILNFRADEQLKKQIADYMHQHNLDQSKAIRELILKGLERLTDNV